VDASLKAALISSAIVGSGGFIGSLARYGVGGLVHRQLPLAIFPYGTLLVNLLGCLLIGAIAGLAESRQLFGPQFRQLALIGILGGFTTFSTFGFETVAMLRDADYLRAGANVGVNVAAGLALVWLGYQVAAR
jgi:CrcB protein